jgi:opacity protein-like surface antigen
MPLQFVDSRALVAAAMLAFAASSSARVEAQSCHAPSLREPTEGGLRLSFTQLAATFEDADGSDGDYQGAIVMLSWSHPILFVELALPGYRLARDTEELGLGDVSADARVALLRSSTDEFKAGLELAVSLPTGDATRDLGMGHTMLMPGIWLRLEDGPFALLAQAGYGAALGEGSHTSSHSHAHEHAGSNPSPRVNPMNRSEFEHALGASFAVHPNVAATARWLGAVALDEDGITREVIAPGLQLTADRLDATLELQLPLAGDPFDFKLLASIGSTL